MDDGGCYITGYQQYSDDGAGGALTLETDSISSSVLELDLDRTSGPGLTYRIQIIALNHRGEVYSNVISIIAAEVPGDPTTAPYKILAYSDEDQLRVEYDEITDTMGSDITSYELQMNDGLNGPFYTIHGGDLAPTLSLGVTLQKNIVIGVPYKFRYRARNKVGWTDWSPISSLSASTVPLAPEKPTYVSSDDTQIVLELHQSIYNGGSVITDYELAIDGTVISEYVYSTDGFSYTVNATEQSMTAGTTYAFTYRAVNENGESLWSSPLRVSLGPLPSTPSNFVRSSTGNSETSIGLSWDKITGDTLPIISYVLYIYGDNYTYIGNDPTGIYCGTKTSYVVTGLNPGSTYSFYISAVNYNGEGDTTELADLKSCVAPYTVYPPQVDIVSSTSITLSWTAPGSDGG